jgi:hypothetical protein
MNNDTLSEAEIKEIVANLKKLSPHGYFPLDIFLELAHLKTTVTVEVVPLCLDPHGEVNVVLFNRGPNDTIWPNFYHNPGACVIADDMPSDDEWGMPSKTYERLKNGELKGIAVVGEPVYVGHLTQQVLRGPESKPVFYQEVDYESAKGHLFPLSKLPENIISHQVNFIRRCAELFLAQKSSANK